MVFSVSIQASDIWMLSIQINGRMALHAPLNCARLVYHDEMKKVAAF
jgi:hypothetical protein